MTHTRKTPIGDRIKALPVRLAILALRTIKPLVLFTLKTWNRI